MGVTANASCLSLARDEAHAGHLEHPVNAGCTRAPGQLLARCALCTPVDGFCFLMSVVEGPAVDRHAHSSQSVLCCKIAMGTIAS